MPLAAPRPCTYPGCRALVARGRCEAHAYPDIAEDRPKYHTAYWRSVRAAQLRRKPFCERCLETGAAIPAQDVHHRDGNSDNDAEENLESLCHSCHSSHTAREHGGFGNAKHG